MFKETIQFSGIAVCMAIFCLSCSTSDDTKKDNIAPADSLEYHQNDSNKRLEKSIPPGTADIEAEIIGYTEEKDDLICKLKIIEVFAYGASVSPLPPGAEIDTYISKNLMDYDTKEIKAGKLILARVSQVFAPGDKKYWTIILINKNK
jgi:hypothetical protein